MNRILTTSPASMRCAVSDRIQPKAGRANRQFVPSLVLLLLLAAPAAAQSPEEFFETRVRPVLAEHCYQCHGRLVRGELRMDSRESLLEGGVSGPAIVPGDPDASLLIRSVRHEIKGREMPQNEDPLNAHQIESLVEWIAMGAPWPVAAAEGDGAGTGGGEAILVTNTARRSPPTACGTGSAEAAVSGETGATT